jgi:bifunctional DNA-binding transcriptional regulator/antitoxin component of YhaV-PrlF toxin-antitoxin module
MSALATEPRQHMSRLTNGWRFTLPTPIRRSRGWDTGTQLVARVRGASLILSSEGDPDEPDVSSEAVLRGNLAKELDAGEISPSRCYLGAGGKIVLPADLRQYLGWVIGKQVVIVDEGDAVALTLCCDVKRCESCGGVSGVRQIIPNVYLCSQCWQKYLVQMNAKLKWGRAKA